MTERVGNIVIIEPEPDGECSFCHKIAELRPYGANDERICYDCAMKDGPTTRAQAYKHMGFDAFTSTEIAETVCVCGYKFTHASSVSGATGPKVGDISFCISCGRIGLFEEGMKVKFLTAEDEALLPDGVMLEVSRARLALRDRKAGAK